MEFVFGFMVFELGLVLREETHGFYQTLMTPGGLQFRQTTLTSKTSHGVSALGHGSRRFRESLGGGNPEMPKHFLNAACHVDFLSFVCEGLSLSAFQHRTHGLNFQNLKVAPT